MITVVTPAESARLTTVAAVRAETGVTAAEMNDAAVEALIDQASGLVAEYCNRVFARETVTESFFGSAAGPLILSRTPVVAITGVTSGGIALTSPDYRLDARSGLLSRISGRGVIAWRHGATDVTYTAGFILPGEEGRDLPVMVERATVLIISAIIAGRQRDPLTKSETVEGVGRTDYWVPGQVSTLPHPEAEGLLRPFVMARTF